MIKLKRIHLHNFCGYQEFEMDLVDNGKILKWVMLYGPNGTFKTTLLEAISLLSSPWTIASRPDLVMLFRKLTYNPDYNPGYELYQNTKNEMRIEGVFQFKEEERKVIIQNTWEKETTGVILNELPRDTYSISYSSKADSPLNTHSFQISSNYKDQFLSFAEEAYGLKCSIPEASMSEEYDSDIGEYIGFYTDFVIEKGNGDKVHYRRFSAGERKIATLISTLFNKINVQRTKSTYEDNIWLIDNIELHVDYKRHMKIIDRMDEFFPEVQIIATTHSPVIIGMLKDIRGMDEKYLFDMEKIV